MCVVCLQVLFCSSRDNGVVRDTMIFLGHLFPTPQQPSTCTSRMLYAYLQHVFIGIICQFCCTCFVSSVFQSYVGGWVGGWCCICTDILLIMCTCNPHHYVPAAALIMLSLRLLGAPRIMVDACDNPDDDVCIYMCVWV